jgi:FMN phosphatase YigB (HAD superfamily)
MTLTLLLDLDDTLLLNPPEPFFRGYVSALSRKLEPFVAPSKMVPQLVEATEAMIANNEICSTLEEIFASRFDPPLHLDQDQLSKVISDFYQNEYDALNNVITTIPFVHQLMDMAKGKGWNVVIATNPLFPQVAVLKRLEWAGIPADEFPYRLITSYETMHFAKPNPAFYAEILGKLGWPEAPVAMVGNSLKDDLLPAAKLNIPCYWVNGDSSKAELPLPPHSASGALEDILPWLDAVSSTSPDAEINSIEGILAVLRSTPPALQTLTASCPMSEWRLHPLHGEWSLLEIMAHLRDVDAEVNLPRFELMSSHVNPLIPGVDSDRLAVERRYNEQDGSSVFKHFCQSRSRLLQILEGYSESDWQQPLRHSFFGPTTRMELAKFIVTHDRTHLQQIAQTIAALH